MGIETSIIEKYKEGFEKFQNYLYEIHSPYYQNQMHEGYFVDYKKFQDFEKLINNLAPEKQEDENENESKAKIETNRISTVNLNEVNNQILNGNRYLIINNSMYELICKQNEQEKKNNKIVYRIITHYLEIYLEEGKIIQFVNNNTNIIDKTVIVGSVLNNNTNNNIINYSNNNQNINNTENMNNSIISIPTKETNADKIYLIMLKYFENENKIISIIRDQKCEQMFQGFLVDKEWVDNWIKYSHYEAVNKEFFQKGKNDKLEIKKLLLKEINNNNLNNDLKKINDVDKFILKDVNQLEDALKNNKSYVILNKEFLSSYVNNVNVNPIKFYLSYQSIIVEIKEGISWRGLTFKTNDNILNLSKIYCEPKNRIELSQNLIQSNKIINKNNINQELMNELKYYKEENEKLKNEINKLRDDNNKLNTELNKAKNTISSYNNIYQQKIQGINNEIIKLNNIITEKDKEIYELKIKSGIYVDFRKIMVVNFISLDYDINCGINCLETETFAEVEERLYKQYEQCRETNNNFICGGNIIKRFKKISENKIKNGGKIQLIIPQ